MKMIWIAIFAIFVLYLIFLIRAYMEDKSFYDHHNEETECPVCADYDITDQQSLHKAVVDTMHYESKYGRMAESKVKT